MKATVLIPTHNHVAPLRHAIASVQAQSLQDFELFVVGDGVGDATRALVQDMAQHDARLHFFDFPKGPRKGEAYRHVALVQASGDFVAYLGDDDIWFPDHLETMAALLADGDFGHTLHIGINAAREMFFLPSDLEDPLQRQRMLTEHFNTFDFTFGGHTMAAYRRLPHGWRTTPDDFPFTDLYMWRQFLAQPWCRARTAMALTALCTQTHQRPDMTDAERAAELAHWRDEAQKPGFRDRLWRHARKQWSDRENQAKMPPPPKPNAMQRAAQWVNNLRSG